MCLFVVCLMNGWPRTAPPDIFSFLSSNHHHHQHILNDFVCFGTLFMKRQHRIGVIPFVIFACSFSLVGLVDERSCLVPFSC